MVTWNMIHQIKLLYDNGNGSSIRAISETLKISRNTVRKYLRMDETQIANYLDDPQRKKNLDGQREYLILLLQKYPRISAPKVMRKLKEKDLQLQVSLRSLRRYLKKLKESYPVCQKRYYEPVIDMIPGVQCQVDPGELRGVEIDGKQVAVYFVAFVLSYSRLIYVSMSLKPINTKIFIAMHQEAFAYFEGVAEECVYDQTKLVTIREEFREIWLNEQFSQFATYKGFGCRVCEGYDPESKGKVESVVKYVKNNFFYGEEFNSVQDVESKLLDWVNQVANVRIHGSTQKIPIEVYQSEEKEKMSPNSTLNDPLNKKDRRKVDKTSLISYKSNKYSVPMKYQSSVVLIEEEGTKLKIYNLEKQGLIAEHDLSYQKGEVIKCRNHYRDLSQMTRDYEKRIEAQVGVLLGKKLCALLKVTSPTIYKDQLLGALQVLDKYCSDLDLSTHLTVIVDRPKLRVSFLRDYLETTRQRESREEQKVIPSSSVSSSLEIYSNLESVTLTEGEYSHV